MSLSNPYDWVSDLAPRTRRRIMLSAGASMALVAGLTLAAVVVPAGTGNAAPAPPDYVAGGGPCTDTLFYLPSGSDADGTPATYYRYSYLYSYRIPGPPGGSYWRYVHAQSTWSGTEWQGVPGSPTVDTWFCGTSSPVPAGPAPTPTPSPTPSPTPDPTATPDPTSPPPDPPGWDCGDGLVIAPDELPWLVDWVAVNTELTGAEQAALEAQPCSFLTYFGDVDPDVEPAPATVLVAGGGAPIGRFAAPARESTACPLYQREVKLVLGRGFKVDFDGPKRNFAQQAADWVWRRLGNTGPAPTEFAAGDVILSLKLRLRVCTDGSAITAVDPPVGGSPDYEAIATAKGQVLGYAPPNGVLAQSHGYVDAASNTTFKSRVAVAFTYSSPALVELPVEFRSNTFTAEITVYKDGTWDYAVSGGGNTGS